MEYTKKSLGLLCVLLLVGSTNGVAGGYCASFTCADFYNQTLIIRKDILEDPYCVIHEITELGQSVFCLPNLNATLLSRSHLLLRSSEAIRSGLFLEYGRDYERVEPCLSENEACPTPPPSTTPSTTPSTPAIDPLKIGVISVVCVLILLLVLGIMVTDGPLRIRNYMYTPPIKEEQQTAPSSDANFPL